MLGNKSSFRNKIDVQCLKLPLVQSLYGNQGMFLLAGIDSVAFLILSNPRNKRGKVVREEFPRKVKTLRLVEVFCVLYGVTHGEYRTC